MKDYCSGKKWQFCRPKDIFVKKEKVLKANDNFFLVNNVRLKQMMKNFICL